MKKLDEAKNGDIIYAIKDGDDKQFVMPLIIKSILREKIFLVNDRKFIFTLIMPNGQIKYLKVDENLYNNNISKEEPYFGPSHLTKFKKWSRNIGTDIDDYTTYRICLDREPLIKFKIDYFEKTIKQDNQEIKDYQNEIVELSNKIEQLKKQIQC